MALSRLLVQRRASAALRMTTFAVLVLAASDVAAPEPASGASAFYKPTLLVSNIQGVAAHTDPLLRNAWGLAHGPSTPFWVANNATGVATLYDGTGQAFPFPPASRLVVTIPPPTGGEPPSAPTGQVFNPTSDFVVSEGGQSGPALFIFDTEDGTISGWNLQVDATHAILEVDNSANGAVYKGLALGASAAGNVLYATDFHNGRIDVFDAAFQPITLDGPFVDKHAASAYGPFGIANIGGLLYVTYAKQDADRHDDVAGVGNGFVDVFDLDGHFVRRFAQSGRLNSPWGLTLAPANFGRFSSALLIGNFGDGHISAFDPQSRSFLGLLSDSHGQPLAIDGLWSLVFGNGTFSAPTNLLYFTAGPNDEEDGLFGSVQACDSNRGCS